MNIGKIFVNDKFTILEVKVHGENKIRYEEFYLLGYNAM
jgi:hypothetical protein